MDCRGMQAQKNAHGNSKRKNYARSPSGNPKGPSLAENYMQLSHFHQVRALCDMSMEQQVREYLNHCPVPVSSEAAAGPGSGALGPPGGPPPPPGPPGCLGSRILSRNANGTIAMTSQPTNESELQLYRVLQRANLLSYYDTFICQGGDDVQQLCEAGEEEFLEIMALVGMASKPLHVGRLQKALQEWVNNPAMFQTPLVPSLPPGHPGGPSPGPPGPPHPGLPGPGGPLGRPAPVSLAQLRPSPPMGSSHSSPSPGVGGGPSMGPGPGPKEAPSPSRMHPPVSTPQPPYPQSSVGDWPPRTTPSSNQDSLVTPPGMEDCGRPGSPCPVLTEPQIRRLAEAAEALVRSLPPHAFADPRPHGRRMCKDLEHVLSMAEDDPRRMDEIRKYAAIYGRFDCKRKPEKPLTLHEVSVNEAAAQICKHIPALLTRRDELFPLARQAVRDSGYPYAKGPPGLDDPCRPQCYGGSGLPSSAGGGGSGVSGVKGFADEEPMVKRPRLDPPPMDKVQIEEEKKKRQERLEGICDQLRSLGRQQEELKVRLQQSRDLQNVGAMPQLQSQLEHLSTQQMQLINEQSELSKQLRRIDKYCSGGGGGKGQYGRPSSCSEQDKGDTDDTDSQFSAYSNNSSPTLSHEAHDSPSQDSNPSHGAPGGPPGGGGGPTPADVFNMKMASVKKTSAQITKQLVQETLMDEGLRVIKELANQIKSEETHNSTSGVANADLPPPSTTPHPPSRPRGRPPRLDRGDYVGTSRIVQGAPPPTPGPPLQNGHHDRPPIPTPPMSSPGSNGVEHHHHHPNGLHPSMGDDGADIATENSLNALLALSQKGMMKQEPSSPAGNIKMD